MILTQMADCASFGLEGLPLPCEEDYHKALEEIVKDALSSELEVEKVEHKLKSGGLCSILKSTTAGKERFSFSNFTEVVKKATREAFLKCEQMLGSGTSHPMWELQFRRILYGRLEYHLAWPLNTQGLRVGVQVIRGEEENQFKVCVTAERWKMTFDEGVEMEATPVWALSLEGKVLATDSLEKEAGTVTLTPMADCSSFGIKSLPLPCEEDYHKALEEIVKDALGSEAQRVKLKLKSDVLCSLLKRTGKERFASSDFAEVIKKATREAFYRCEQLLGSGTKDPLWEVWFRRFLHQRLEYYLALPLKSRELRVCVQVVAGDEDNHFKVCVTAERWNMTFEEDEPTPSVEATPVWGLSLEGKVLVADSLETEAAAVVAKTLDGRGEDGLGQLPCPKKLKELIREFMDKVEKPEGITVQVDAS